VLVNEFFVNYRASALGRVAGVARVLVIGQFFVIDRENTKMSQNVGRLRKAPSIKNLSSTESRSNKINFFRQKTAGSVFQLVMSKKLHRSVILQNSFFATNQVFCR